MPGTKLRTDGGPLLITHWGLSGPAILKLSAWGARELAARNYEFAPSRSTGPARNRATRLARELDRRRDQNPKKQITTWSPLGDCRSGCGNGSWSAAGIAATTPWAHLSATPRSARSRRSSRRAELKVVGKSMFKEEFVTCGGVRLAEVDFKHDGEPAPCPGLHFAGEVLDIDGVTGGFNFQSAWTTGWLAGQAMAGNGETGRQRVRLTEVR